jgi:hypothetical protein
MRQNVNPEKVAAIVSMQEQMVETRAWKKARGLVNQEKCRLCGQKAESVIHLAAGCTALAGCEYVRRHNNALKILLVTWAKEKGLLPPDNIWYKMKWDKGAVLENSEVKMCWDFEYKMRKETTARRPDATLEYKNRKLIQLVDMACPAEANIDKKISEKLQKYQQLAYEIRERRPGYRVEVIPVVLGCMGGGITRMRNYVRRILQEEVSVKKTTDEMLKTVLMESESIVRKVLSGVIQPDC